MAGSAGRLTVDLANTVALESITIMHIHPALAPNGDVSSAPKDFRVFAYEATPPLPSASSSSASAVDAAASAAAAAAASTSAIGDDLASTTASSSTTAAADAPRKVEVLSGTFDAAEGCRTFPLAKRLGFPVRRVTLEVVSNHGRGDLTCLYRFMVHGEPFKTVVG